MRIAWIAFAILDYDYSWAQSPERSRTSVKITSEKSEANEKEGLSVTPTTNNPLPIILIQSSTDASHAAEREKYSDQFKKGYLNSQIRVAEAFEIQIDSSIAAAVMAGAGTLIADLAFVLLGMNVSGNQNQRQSFD